MLLFNRKKHQSKEMFLLEVYEGQDHCCPVDSIYFENAELMINVVKKSLTDNWMKEYHPVWDDQFLERLSVQNLLHNDYDSRGAVLDLEKNEKYSNPDQWLQADVFKTLPKEVRLVITVVDVFH